MNESGFWIEVNAQRKSSSTVFRLLHESIQNQLVENHKFYYLKNTKILDKTGNIFQPNIVLTQDKIDKKAKRTTLNPFSIIDIIEPSSFEKDKNLKPKFYQQIPSLEEYILIFSEGQKAEHFFRNDSKWEVESYNLSDSEIHLKSGITLTKQIFEHPNFVDGSAPPREPYKLSHTDYKNLKTLYEKACKAPYENTLDF